MIDRKNKLVKKLKKPKKPKKKLYINHIISLIMLITMFSNIYVFASEENENSTDALVDAVKESISKSVGLDEYIENINESISETEIEGIDFEDIASSLITTNNIDYKNIILKLLSVFFTEVVGSFKGATIIYVITLIMAVISSMELEKNSDITKIAHLACFAGVATISITTFIDIITSFKKVIGILTTLMQTISPFLMAILISTGAITSTGIIEPMLLFIASAVGFIVNYVVVPFFSISVAINVISAISENFNLKKTSKLFSSSAIWIVGVMLTFFLGVLTLETNLTVSVDALAVKTTQSAVSNFVPVVGKFFSDSFESVVGATQIIGKVGGTIGIIAVLIVALVPVIKIVGVMIIYSVLAALMEPVCKEENVIKFISSFANVYKNLLGVLIGITILFVISTGIILNLIGSVIK